MASAEVGALALCGDGWDQQEIPGYWRIIGTLGGRGDYGRNKILESKVGIGGPSEIVEDGESRRYILEVGGKYRDVWGW